LSRLLALQAQIALLGPPLTLLGIEQQILLTQGLE
jgi:hypothetical protein